LLAQARFTARTDAANEALRLAKELAFVRDQAEFDSRREAAERAIQQALAFAEAADQQDHFVEDRPVSRETRGIFRELKSDSRRPPDQSVGLEIQASLDFVSLDPLTVLESAHLTVVQATAERVTGSQVVNLIARSNHAANTISLDDTENP
jgi:hypothetical protein